MKPVLTSCLFVRTDRLGETLLNLPAVQALKAAWPDRRLVVMVHPLVQDLLVGQPGLDEVVAEPACRGPWWMRAWQLSRVWRAWNPATILISNPKREYHLAAWLARIPTRVGYDRKWGWTLTHRLSDQKALGASHEVEYNLRLLSVLHLAPPSTPSLRLHVSPHEEQAVSQLFGDLQVADTERLVAVHPWTSNPKKQWPIERSRRLLQQLTELAGVRPMIIGGQEEQTRVRELGLEGESRLLNLVGRLSLKELAACLRRVRVLVTNDSGPMHVAAAVGIPVIALFGTEDAGSHPRRWGPWGPGHTVIQKPLRDITVDEVVEAIQRYL